jgi:FAD/FMN-containing dehydrogenase
VKLPEKHQVAAGRARRGRGFVGRRVRVWRGRGRNCTPQPSSRNCFRESGGSLQNEQTFQHMRKIGEEFGSSIGNVFYLGDGSLHPVVLYDSRELRAYAKAIAAPEENICSRVEFGGALTVEHGVGMRKNELKTLMNLHRSGSRLDEASSGRRIVAESGKDFFAEQRVGRFA